METNQTKQIAKITGDMEMLIEHSSILTKGHNMLTGKQLNETDYLELSINLFRKDMFDVLVELDYDTDEFQVLDDVTMTLKNVLDDERASYEFTVITGDSVTQQETNRKGYLLSMLEWSLNELQGNIEMEVM